MSLLLWRPGEAEFLLVCLWAHLQPPTNRTQLQCSATSVEVPVTLPETVGSPGANHKERSWRYAVISANHKDMLHRGVRKTRSASCNEGESQWNGLDSVGGFWLILIRCEWNVMSTRRMEKYHNSDSRQEVPFKPWCWQHNFTSDQQKSLNDERACGKQQAIGIRPPFGNGHHQEIGRCAYR